MCGGFVNSAEHKVTFSPDELIKGLEAIFDGFDVRDDIQPDIFRETLRLFNLAAAKGISESHYEDAVTDEFLEQIKHNNEVFSAFRTHRMQNDIAAQLIDADGHLKSWDKFRRDVAPLTGKYCKTWLNTEYNTAIIRAHRAADWKHFVNEQDVYPNLRWMPTTSATPDPVHETFWSKKLTLSVNDPFWGHHHPGERWGCKCTCEQTDDPVNDLGLSEATKDTASKGLKGNPGETGKLFSEDHPYFPKSCGGCPFNNGLKNRFKGFFNKEKDCSSCMAVANGIVKAGDLQKTRQDFFQLIHNVESNRPTGKVSHIGKVTKKERRKLEKHFEMKLVSDIVSISDRRLLHALRPSKVAGGRAVVKNELVSELLNINSLDIYTDPKQKNTIFLVKRHEKYFNKYVFRINSSKYNKESQCIEFVTAGRIDIIQLSAYIKIK